jgi:exopolyphosphatase / guanosine-5'-triphosphate,3'-diphosphate pyrophosphatase
LKPEPTDRRVAVIDIGSNSGRVVVYRRDAAGRLRIAATTRAALRLVRDVDDQKRFRPESIERTVAALADFRAIALGARASEIRVVATAAMRDAKNGAELVERVRRELGLEIEVIPGDREAWFGFLGALHGLPVESGAVFDVGGGSMQVTLFRERRMDRAWSFPLGALRLSHQFLASDPPEAGELRALRRHVREVFQEAGVPGLRTGDALVGTGGTVRNLAKIDRHARGYPLTRVHGYVVTRSHVHEIAADLSRRRQKKRDDVKGLSGERGDSIVGGALAIETLMEFLDASEITVSGQGVREGMALSALAGDHLPSAEEVRAASVASLCARFDAWNPDSARRRAAVAAALFAALEPSGRRDTEQALGRAATVLDIGRSVDFFERHAHTADILVATDLDGFTHREIALTACLVRLARDEDDRPDYKPLLTRDDEPALRRAGLLLALADDIEERCPGTEPISVQVASPRDQPVTIRVGGLLAWRPRGLRERFSDAFGCDLKVQPA